MIIQNILAALSGMARSIMLIKEIQKPFIKKDSFFPKIIFSCLNKKLYSEEPQNHITFVFYEV